MMKATRPVVLCSASTLLLVFITRIWWWCCIYELLFDNNRNSSEIDGFHQLSLLHWHIIINFTPCGDILDIQHNRISCLKLLVLFAWRYKAALTPWFFNVILYVGIRFWFFFGLFPFSCFSLLRSYFLILSNTWKDKGFFVTFNLFS